MTLTRQPSQSTEASSSADKKFNLNTSRLVPEERLKTLDQELTKMKDESQKSHEESTQNNRTKKN